VSYISTVYIDTVQFKLRVMWLTYNYTLSTFLLFSNTGSRMLNFLSLTRGFRNSATPLRSEAENKGTSSVVGAANAGGAQSAAKSEATAAAPKTTGIKY